MANSIIEGKIFRMGIVGFWTLFWFFNVIDKFIGGSAFLFVGSDRFALFVKLFSSLGIGNQNAFFVSLGSLIIATIIEIIAFALLLSALWHLFQHNDTRAETLFFWGSFTGLVLFSFFAIGDQIFGDRVELLEHSIFWIALIMSWGAYIYFPKEKEKIEEDSSDNSSNKAPMIMIVAMSLIATAVLTFHGIKKFPERTKIVEPAYLGQGVYSFEMLFLSGGNVWEKSLTQFIGNHPELRVTAIYTIPNELKTKADNVIIFVITEKR
jgi:hypothetical protein